MGFQKCVCLSAEFQLEIAASVNLHDLCPHLNDISSGCSFIFQYVNLGLFRAYHDWKKTAVACSVKGKKIKRVGRTAKHTLSQSVCRMGLIRYLVGFLLSAQKGLDFLNALGVGCGNHF